MPSGAERRGIELIEGKEGIPILNFNPKPKGQRLCTFLLDVQIIEVTPTAVRLQVVVNGTVSGRIHTFEKPTQEQMKLLTPYLWRYVKMEATLILPDTEIAEG